MPKKEYSVELTKLLEILKTNNPTQLQNKRFKDLNQDEREIYRKALKKKGQTDRKKLFRLLNKGIHKKIWNNQPLILEPGEEQDYETKNQTR